MLFVASGLILLPIVLGARAPVTFTHSIIRSSNADDKLMKAPFASGTALFYQLDEGPGVASPTQKIINEHKHIIFRPAIPETMVSNPDVSTHALQQQSALVLLPGCFLNPQQYEAFALAIQQHAEHPVWVVVPQLIGNMANPWTSPRAIKQSLDALHSIGYPSDKKVFIGGHSLGGIFLPEVFDRLDPNYRNIIAGKIFLGSFVGRHHREAKDAAYRNLPRLTVAGDLDGLIRSSRIAEDIEHHVSKPISIGHDADETRLNHSVVLIQGMNHFQLTESTFAHIMVQIRDLPAEISREEATRSMASVVAEFIEIHEIKDKYDQDRKESLLEKIKNTEDYLRPLLAALKLEGNHHIAAPCNTCEEEDSTCNIDCNSGSRWVEQMQTHLKPMGVQASDISDQFQSSGYFNPFADPPFYHPKVQSDGADKSKVKMETFSEAVYEKPDFLFDGGFFSNTALELRAKFNSPQSIWHALGISVPFEPGKSPCSKMNELTIQYALDHAPHIVRKRYLERGIKLRAGQDIEHNNGPSWIWSRLDFSEESKCGDDDEPCRIIDSHTLSTDLDHPVPFVGGKLYCKLLSPARVLEWMYVDSLRRKW